MSLLAPNFDPPFSGGYETARQRPSKAEAAQKETRSMKTKTTGGKSAKKSVGGVAASTAKNNTPASVQTEEVVRCTPNERELTRMIEAGASLAELREAINEVPASEVDELLRYCEANHEGSLASHVLRERIGEHALLRVSKTGEIHPDDLHRIERGYPAHEYVTVDGVRYRRCDADAAKKGGRAK